MLAALAAHASMQASVFDGIWAKLRGTACGFDSGDFLNLGHFEESKYRVNVSAG